jgi:hypothetical protein
MKLKLVLAAIVVIPLTLTACAKNDAPASHEGQAAPVEEKVTQNNKRLLMHSTNL